MFKKVKDEKLQQFQEKNMGEVLEKIQMVNIVGG